MHYINEIFGYNANAPMIFNSGIFLLLFIVFISVYALIHKNRLSVTLFVIAFSLLFYYKSSGWYLWILVFTTISDFAFALAITQAKKLLFKRIWLFLSVGVSLGILAYFKYTNFLLENFHTIVGDNFQPLDIFLPIGISFYTFQSISYVLDVYWKKLEPTTNILDYAFFLTFFPQLVAGPIVKANLFLPQLRKPISIKKEWVYAGLWLIMVGLFKKAVIADYIAQYNDLVFKAPGNYSGFENLMAALGYSLQIYCDFSGYSDMAIGLGKIMGFDLGVNFNFPYKALNITDFWRRWHISLSSWLRDYLYIPLGGNRKGKLRMYVNLFITMLLGGLWHGASWKFVFWGAGHGIGLAVHKALKDNLLSKLKPNFAVNFLSWAATFIFVLFLWIFFRANDVQHQVYKHNLPIKDSIYVEANIITNNNRVLQLTNVKKDSIVGISEYNFEATRNKFSIQRDTTGKTETIIVNEIENAYSVAWTMIDKIATDTDFAYTLPFIKVRYVWFIFVVIGFLMHAVPTNWNDKIKEAFIRSPYIVKIIIFIILVQLVVQFKPEGVQPFIYFQF